MVHNCEEEITSIETVSVGKQVCKYLQKSLKCYLIIFLALFFLWLLGDRGVSRTSARPKMQFFMTLVNVTLENE